MSELPPALPHGPIEEVFPDVFQVRGGFRFMPALSITRNMTIVRQGGELTVVNSVRLTDAGERELEKLGKVTHVVRIGAFHGADDPWFVRRFGASLWAPAGLSPKGNVTHDHELKPGNSPIEGSSVFLFERGQKPEAALVLERDGGILLTCDSFQNWTTFDGCSPAGKVMMRVMGFGPTLIGGPWLKYMGPEIRGDFDRLAKVSFKHLAPAHGTVLRDVAAAGLEKAMRHRFA